MLTLCILANNEENVQGLLYNGNKLCNLNLLFVLDWPMSLVHVIEPC